MSDIVRPSVSSLPTLPLTSDTPATFSARADAVVAALNSVGTGASGLGTYLDHVAGRAALTSSTWPAFCARTTSAYTWSAAPATFTFASETVDNGAAFNGQLFTAPVSGLYLFKLDVILFSPGAYTQTEVGIFVVGGGYFARTGAEPIYGDTSTGANSLSCFGVQFLTAGQQVGAQLISTTKTGVVVDGLYGSIFAGALLP